MSNDAHHRASAWKHVLSLCNHITAVGDACSDPRAKAELGRLIDHLNEHALEIELCKLAALHRGAAPCCHLLFRTTLDEVN
jgi:hypothetical protein